MSAILSKVSAVILGALFLVACSAGSPSSFFKKDIVFDTLEPLAIDKQEKLRQYMQNTLERQGSRFEHTTGWVRFTRLPEFKRLTRTYFEQLKTESRLDETKRYIQLNLKNKPNLEHYDDYVIEIERNYSALPELKNIVTLIGQRQLKNLGFESSSELYKSITPVMNEYYCSGIGFEIAVKNNNKSPGRQNIDNLIASYTLAANNKYIFDFSFSSGSLAADDLRRYFKDIVEGPLNGDKPNK
jgi:hypothetical protein